MGKMKNCVFDQRIKLKGINFRNWAEKCTVNEAKAKTEVKILRKEVTLENKKKSLAF